MNGVDLSFHVDEDGFEMNPFSRLEDDEPRDDD